MTEFNKGDRVRYVYGPGRGIMQSKDGLEGIVTGTTPVWLEVKFEGYDYSDSYYPKKFDLVERAVPATVTPIRKDTWNSEANDNTCGGKFGPCDKCKAASKPGLAVVHEARETEYPFFKVAVEDVVNSPSHYTQYPHEVIEFTEHMDFCKGNAVKYIARAGFKGGPEKEIEDLEKAKWYIDRKIKFLKASA